MTGKMGRLTAVAGLGLALALGWAWTGFGQQAKTPTRSQDQGVAEKIGEKLDDAAKRLGRGAKEIAGDVRERFQQAKTSVNNMGIESRVYGRLHWDKALNQAVMDLEVDDAGVVTLRGAVADAAAKARAADLTMNTLGVSRVVNELTIGLPPAAVDTETTTIKRTTPGGTTSETTTIRPVSSRAIGDRGGAVSRRSYGRPGPARGRLRSGNNNCACPTGAARSGGHAAAGRGGD